jgi:hypothetical protein
MRCVSTFVLAVCSGLCGVGSAATHAAVRPAAAGPARVTWVHPERVTAKQREALTRLLIAAAEGKTGGFIALESRPVHRTLTCPNPSGDTRRPNIHR